MNRSARSAVECGDFLKKEAQTPLHEFFLVCGSPWEIWTNCKSILEAAREAFIAIGKPQSSLEFRVRLWVDSEEATERPWPKPFVRGLDHLVYAGFDCGSSALIDLRSHRLAGRFSKQMGTDCDYWKTVIFPIFLSIVGGSVGLTEIHSACVATGGNGLLLAGPSGSGKSTLSLALAQVGFRFLSDDRTFCSLHGGRLLAWGTSALLKLRPEAEAWFEELKNEEPNDIQNSEAEVRFEPQQRLGIKRVRECEPRMIIFLERVIASGFRLRPVTRSEAALRLEQDLMAELPEAVKRQAKSIEKLVDLPSWRLQYDEAPRVIAQRLLGHFERFDYSWLRSPASFKGRDRTEQAAEKAPLNEPRNDGMLISSSTQVKTKRPDPLHRLTATPYATSLPIMGRSIRLETNDARILEHVTNVFAVYPGSPGSTPEFLWKIVSQSRPQMNPPWPKRSAFSDSGLRFAEFGQSNFLAVDLDAREAIGFLCDGLIEDQLGLTSPFFDNLFCMTAGSLRLVPLWANCVVLGQRGLLVFGVPNSGKTTASYLAAKLGLEFHADEGVFVEAEAGQLRAWGGFWPAAFRPEALQFLPELQACTRPFFYQDFTFYHLQKHEFRTTQVHSVTPVGCVFLKRGVPIHPSLSPIPRTELPRRLVQNVLFKDDDRFTQQHVMAFSVLEKLPAYQLTYGSDPATAAPFLKMILADRWY